MAETFEPFDGGPLITEDGWSALFGGITTSGVIDRNGISSASLRVYTDQDGRQVKVSAGRAVVRGHYYVNTLPIVLPLTTNTTTYTRIDYVVLRLDTNAKTVHPFVISGTPAATPLVPTLTQQPGGVWDVPLAQITVPAAFTAVTPAQVADVRQWAAPLGFDKWQDYAVDYHGTVNEQSGAGATHARYKLVGDTCFVSWSAHVQPSGTVANGYNVSLPVPPADNGSMSSAVVQNQLAPLTTFSDGTKSWAAVRAPFTLQGTNVTSATPLLDKGLTFDGSGNGFTDFAVPPLNIISIMGDAADPVARNGYVNMPTLGAAAIGGVERIVGGGGPANSGVGVTARYLGTAGGQPTPVNATAAVTTDSSGNGFVDFPGLSYAQITGFWAAVADPAVSGYPQAVPSLCATDLGGSTRVVVTRGKPSSQYTVVLRFIDTPGQQLASVGTVANGTVLDANGNGYVDFASVPFAVFVNAWPQAANPPVGGYPGYPVCSVCNINGYARVVLSHGQPGLQIGVEGRFISRFSQTVNGPFFQDGFTFTYQAAPGA